MNIIIKSCLLSVNVICNLVVISNYSITYKETDLGAQIWHKAGQKVVDTYDTLNFFSKKKKKVTWTLSSAILKN